MKKLTAVQKRAIIERILTLDPEGKIVSLSPNSAFSGGSIAYNKASGITLHENISRLTDEEYVRAYLVVRLIRELRYPAEALELEKGYTIGRPTGKSAQLDIRVLDKRDRKKKSKTFMLIEAKRPDDYESYSPLMEDQLFAPGNHEHAAGVRYVAWYSLDVQENEFRDQCIIVDFRKFTDFDDWTLAGQPGHNLNLPAEYGTVRKHKYIKGSEIDLRTDLTRIDLTRLQRDFHNVLWGGAKMGDTDVFNNLLKMFIAKIFDEQTTEDGEAYRFQIELKDGSPETAAEILAKVNRIYQEALRHYFRYPEDVIRLSNINKEKFKPEKVAYVMERLESVSLIENKFEDDVLGAFFEGIVRTGFKQEKGQFFTHTNIVRFMLYALDLDEWAIEAINGTSPRLLYIIDPSCGSGTFLIEAMKLITKSVLHTHYSRLKRSQLVRDYVQEWFQPNSPNKNIHNRWAREFIYGVEDNEDLAMATKVNMILHGDGNANIEKGDGLADFDEYERDRTREKREDPNHPYKCARNEQFDCILSNPPFSLKEDDRTIARYGTRFAYAERKNSENLFLERWYQLLKERGRLGVVLPDSVFDTNENLYIRVFLYRFFTIKAVVSLPQVSFQPYTPTKTSLLFAEKKSRKEVDAWDGAWRKAANEYSRIRSSGLVRYVLENERIRNSLIQLVNRAEVEWYPSTNLLSDRSLPKEVREQITKGVEENPVNRRKLASVLEEFDRFVEADGLRSSTSEEGNTTLARLLRDRLTPSLAALPLPKRIEGAYDDIVEASDLNFTEEPKGRPYCNAWWCFAEVTSQEMFDYDIFFAEADKVGYKRTTRHPEGIPQPNDLFREDKDGEVVIDTKNPKTILDHLRRRDFFFSEVETLDEAEDCRAFARRFSHVANGFTLRFSSRFMHPKFALLRQRFLTEELTTPLRKFCARPITRGVQPEYDESEILAVKTGTLRNGYLDLSEPQTVNEDFFERFKRRAGLKRNDILIACTGVGSLGKVDLYEQDEPAVADGHIAIFRSSPLAYDPKLLVHLMRHRLVQWQIEQALTGATNQIEIYAPQLESLLLPILPLPKRKGLLAKILRIEGEIKSMRASLQTPEAIINEILCKEFGYPLKKHLERAREHQFVQRFSNLGSSFTLRNSTKFHHPDFELVDEFFANTPHVRIRQRIEIPIRLGATAKKTDLIEDGEAYYVHPGATRRQGRINLDDCHQITQEFYGQFRHRFGLQREDIVLNRAGEGTIGKAGLFDSDEPALFSDFTMRIRFAERVTNRLFAWYFLRSIMFQAQIERSKRGMGNMTNIFPGQVQQMLMVDCPRGRQNTLAKEIGVGLRKLDVAREGIAAKQKEIQTLIEAAIL